MKFIEFHYRIKKQRKTLIIPRQNHESHEIYRIPCQNHENHENLIIPCQNYENHEVHRIPCQNHENHDNFKYSTQESATKMKFLEFESRIQQIKKIYLF